MTTPTAQDIRYAITAEDRFSRTFAALKRDMAQAKEGIGGIATSASALNLRLGAITLGAAGAGGLVLGIRQLAHDLDALNDASDATGSTVENLSALERVARLNGATLETVSSAALKLNKVLTEAQPDTPMAKALNRIGLDAAELRRLDPSEAVLRVAQALSNYADDGNKARLIQELFGKSTRELAPFLKDLAEAGRLNATVTSEQAREAERFNKQIALMATNANDAARSITSSLLPGINQLFERLRAGREVYGGFMSFLASGFSAGASGGVPEAVQNARVAYEKSLGQVEKFTALQATQGGKLSFYDATLKANAESALATATKRYDYFKRLQQLEVVSAAGSIAQDPRLRVSTPSVGPAAPAARAGASGPSEAERRLEQLQREAEGYDKLSAVGKLLLDIDHKRISGLTPDLERRLKLEAQAADRLSQQRAESAQLVDLQKHLNAEKEKAALIDTAVLANQQRGFDEAQALAARTPSGRLQGIEAQVDKVQAFSRALPQDDPRQKQLLEAMQQLRKEADDLIKPADEAKTAFDRMADSIEKSMERSTDAVIDFALSGQGSVADLGKAFAHDVLRGLIEDPIRDTMKSVSKSIRDALNGDDVKGLLGSLVNGFGFGGSGDGAGGGLGGLLSSIGGFFGSTGRAMGGGVNQGELVRWNENGREWFVPGANGAVITQAQLASMGRAGGGGLTQHNTFNISGGDPATMQRQIEAALARSNAQAMRQMRIAGSAVG